MQLTQFVKMIVLLSACIAIGSPANADLIIDFSVDNGSTFTSQVSGNIGDSFTVGVYARQTNLDTRFTVDGLTFFGLRATRVNGLAEVSEVEINGAQFADFGMRTGVESSTEFSLVGDALGLNPVRTSNIALGSFQVEITGAVDTVFAFGDISAIESDFRIGDFGFTDIDADLFSVDPVGNPTDRSKTYELTLSAVPEPSSLGLWLSLTGLATLGLRRRR